MHQKVCLAFIKTRKTLPLKHRPSYSTCSLLQKQNECLPTFLHAPAFSVPSHCSLFSHGSNNCLLTTTQRNSQAITILNTYSFVSLKCLKGW